MSDMVAIGVPAYRGAEFIGETLKSIRDQTHREFQVLISVDGGDEETAAACESFVRDDSRFAIVVQEKQLGWDGNISYLMAQNEGDYWYFHQQDDLIAPEYIEVLLDHARDHPSAAVTYCDLKAFGKLDVVMRQQSILGAPLARELSMIVYHFAAIAFRGLVRADALRTAGALRPNEVESFAAEVAWMAQVARADELHRVPATLYFKRYHDSNVHTKWGHWPLEKLMRAWQVHCRDVFLEAVRINVGVVEKRLIWHATLARLTSTTVSPYLPPDRITALQRRLMLPTFLDAFNGDARRRAQTELNMKWPDIEAMSYRMLDLPLPTSRAGQPKLWGR